MPAQNQCPRKKFAGLVVMHAVRERSERKPSLLPQVVRAHKLQRCASKVAIEDIPGGAIAGICPK